MYYSTKDAAEYLGVKLETIYYHVYKSGYLPHQKFGRDIVFTKEQLDEFKAADHKPGKPPKK